LIDPSALIVQARGAVGRLEDRPQLTRLVMQVLHLRTRRDLTFDQYQQPMLGFVRFFDNGAQLGDVFTA